MRRMRLHTVIAFGMMSCVGRLAADPMAMPTTQGQSLAGLEVVLPSATAGHQAVIVIGFSHASQKSMERWIRDRGTGESESRCAVV